MIPLFEYVYVNQDGTVRQLSGKEQDYLSEDFSGGDGGWPYIKGAYTDVDGWGSLSGFLARAKVPPGMAVLPVNPRFDSFPEEFVDDIADNQKLGDTITRHPDGSLTCTPNLNLSSEQRVEMTRRLKLEQQSRRERLARHPDHLKK